MFANLEIRWKILTGGIAILAAAAVVISLFVVYDMKSNARDEIEAFRQEETEKIKRTLKNYVDIAYGSFTTKEKSTAVQDIKKMRYDQGTGYFWINDMGKPSPKMVMHPTVPALDGKVLDSKKYNCALGKKENLFKAFVDVCEQEGEGFVDYLWPKPTKDGLTAEQPKLSYVRLYKPYNWIVGTGVYIDSIDEMVAQKREALNGRIWKMLTRIALVGIVVLVVAVASLWFIAGLISNPLAECARFARDVGKGNFNARINITSKDEVGMLAGSLQEMSANLQQSMEAQKRSLETQKDVQKIIHANAERLQMAVDELSEQAREMDAKSSQIAEESNSAAETSVNMSANMTTVSDSAEQSQASIDSIAVAIEEMTATVGEIAQNTEKARTITSEAVTGVQNASDKIDSLSKASEEITSVIETIVEIAEQTKLLALNATIEAARAGEAGKGFAVVASEVKELAKQTNDATSDIKSKIEAMHSSSDSTIVEIRKISDVINDVTDIVSTIAAAVEEQSVTSQDIAQNVSSAATQTKEVTGNVVEAADATKQIAEGMGKVNGNIAEVKGVASNVNESVSRLAEIGGELLQTMEKLDET